MSSEFGHPNIEPIAVNRLLLADYYWFVWDGPQEPIQLVFEAFHTTIVISYIFINAVEQSWASYCKRLVSQGLKTTR